MYIYTYIHISAYIYINVYIYIKLLEVSTRENYCELMLRTSWQSTASPQGTFDTPPPMFL